MRQTNSVGGQRVYPGSPGFADDLRNSREIIGQFNDGMDRLRRDRELTANQQEYIDSLDANHPIKRLQQLLTTKSDMLWQYALEKQNALNQGLQTGPYTTAQLGELLIGCADRWRQLKDNIP